MKLKCEKSKEDVIMTNMSKLINYNNTFNGKLNGLDTRVDSIEKMLETFTTKFCQLDNSVEYHQRIIECLKTKKTD